MSSKEHWNCIYTDHSPIDLSWHQETPELSLKLINNNLSSKKQSIIDVGGASTLVDHLIIAG